MTEELSSSAQCYGLYDKNKIIGFMGIIHFPHPNNSKIKRVTRLVILPDYQGIGLGVKFLNSVASLYKNFDFRIVTSAKNLIYALNASSKWKLDRYQRDGNKNSKNMMKTLLKTSRRHVKTASFKYVET